ncbi:MAG: TonB-dependent receptor [Chitinophagaceae bacterium]|nr:MAG: TonB-dependent receptor [Chitinophagaceae bacterium]
MKKIYLAGIAILLSQLVFSQGSVTGTLVDADTKKPLYLSTITVYKAADTSIISYRLSDKEGSFKIPGLPLHTPLRALVTFSGYTVIRKDFTLTDNAPFNLDSLLLTPNSASLDEVLVISERPPMTIRKDTIEFNASAFKTLPNALVEDLLKKLPGVQVDKEGNITVNGKRVNRIMVDGKTFFGDDPKMATRNLPSNVIDKIQVTDDKEEMLRNGDDNVNNVGKVVNLTFKKGVKKGVFGKAYAGAGTEGRFEGGAIANTFRDTLQVSVLGYTNNLNRPGFSFSELMQTGGMQRNSDVNSNRNVSIWNNSGGGSGIKINDINFGGITEYGGVSTSSGIGVNINHSPNTKKSIFGQYFYGNVKVDADRDGYTEYNNADTVLRRTEDEDAAVIVNAHNIGLGAKLKPDSVTNIVAGINFMMGKTVDERNTLINSQHSVWGNLSDGNVGIDRTNISKNYSHYINLNKLSKNKKGRRFNLNHNFSWKGRDNESLTNSLINYKYPNSIDSSFNQLRTENIPTLNTSVSGNFSEPFTKRLSARVDARYEYEQLKNSINTFDYHNSVPEKNSTLSNVFTRTSNTASTSAGLEYRYKKLTITPRLRYQWQHFENKLASLNDAVIQELRTVLPELSIVYGKLNINYSKRVILPNYKYLIPVFDNTNPYIINNGNPDLLPAISHSVEVNMHAYDPKMSLNVWGWARAATSTNDVIQNIIQQNDGTQIILPVNAKRGKNISGNAGVNKENKFSQKFTMTSNIGFYYEYKENYFSYNSNLSKQFSNNLSLWGGVGFNWNDVFEWNNTVNYSFQKVKNSNTDIFKSYSTTDYEISSEQILRWPKHIIFENNVAYVRNNSFVAAPLREFVRWSAAVNITMLKNEAGVLRLGVYDLLRKMNNTSVDISQNMLRYSNSNVLGNYYMATFTYNLRPTGAKKKVGGQSLLLF